MYKRGKIKLNNIDFQFILLNDDLEIIFENMKDVTSVSNINYKDRMFICHGNESLNVNKLNGIGDDGIRYEFYICSSQLTFNNSFKCKVCYYVTYYNLQKVDDPNQKRLVFTGNEIDGMANYNTLYQQVYNPKMQLKAIDLELYRNKDLIKHEFVVNDVKYSLYYADGFTANTCAKHPIEFKNYMYLESNDIKNIEDYYDIYLKIKNLLSFIYHRRNIRFDTIKIQAFNGTNYFEIGEFVVFDNKTEVEEIDKKKAIKYEQISPVLTRLVKEIFNNDLHLDHIPSSLASNRSVTAGSFVILLAAFQYEFDRFYSVEHSQSSTKIKNEMFNELSKLMENSNNKKKKKYQVIIDHLDDDILEAKILHIFKKYPNTMERLGKKIYTRNNFNYDKNEIATRLAKQRNNFAHGNIKNKFELISLVDFLFLEKIVYFIQLVNLGLDEDDVVEISDRITIA